MTRKVVALTLIILTFVGVISLIAWRHAGDDSIQTKTATASKKVTICFRYDDICASVNDLQTYREVVDVFEESQVPLTLGVIPFRNGTDRFDAAPQVSEWLHEASDSADIEIALHGFTHRAIAETSEWHGVPLKRQEERMRAAASMLRDVIGHAQLTTFIPPWNSFDLNTMRALRQNNFQYLSGDVGILRGAPFRPWQEHEARYFGLKVVPGTCSLRALPRALYLAKQDAAETVIVVIFHPYDFQSSRSGAMRSHVPFTITELQKTLRQLSFDPRVSYTTIGNLSQQMLPPERYNAACRYDVALRILLRCLPQRWCIAMGVMDEASGHWLHNDRYLITREYVHLERKCLGILLLMLSAPGFLACYLASRLVRAAIGLRGASLVFWTSWTGVLVALHFRVQMLTAPTMHGLFSVYCLAGLFAYLGVILAYTNKAFRSSQASAKRNASLTPASGNQHDQKIA